MMASRGCRGVELVFKRWAAGIGPARGEATTGTPSTGRTLLSDQHLRSGSAPEIFAWFRDHSENPAALQLTAAREASRKSAVRTLVQPLLTPRHKETQMKPRILVPFDFSESAEKALSWAADLHSTTKSDEPIHVVHLISSFPFGDSPSTVDMLFPNADEVETLRRQVTDAAAKAGARAVVDVIIRPISVGDAVMSVAEEVQADLIVMGTHGRTGVKRLVLGSVAEHVTRRAACPVVTVRAGQPSGPAAPEHGP
jgi:nucleotide-binding universal stress UspA family protein